MSHQHSGLDASAHPGVACIKFVFLPPSEAHVAEQLAAMRRYAPLVLATTAPDGMGLPSEAIHALGHLSAPARTFNRMTLKLARRSPYLERQVRRAGCRLIHAQCGVEGLYGLHLKARTGLPLVTSFSGTDATRLPQRSPRMYERLFATGDLFLACSEATRRQLLALGCPDNRLLVHHVGVDPRRIAYHPRQPSPDGAVNVLLVGRMVERKGLPYALQAFAAVCRYHRRVALTVIGDGPDRPAIEALMSELNLRTVRLLGEQPRDIVLSEMQQAHLYLQPSIRASDGDAEGIPVALIEALAAGLPAVATWHSGIPEAVGDGKNGYLVSERDSHALAERLRLLIEHPELWGPLGRAGRTLVEQHFNLRRQVDRLEACYDDLLAGKEATGDGS